MKKLLLNRMFIAVSVLACVNFFSFTTSAFSGSGAGTYADPYQITSAAQLAEVKDSVYSGAIGYRTASYKLMTDIDLTDWITTNSPTTGWPGIGSGTPRHFQGNFDGNGHTIFGIWSTYTGYGMGLFHYAGGTVEIKNLGVIVASGKSIQCAGASGRCAAGIVGWFYAGSLTISSCYVQGDITATEKIAGALVGYSVGNTTITNCYAGGGTITHGFNNDGSGGIMGTATGAGCVTTITNCYAANSVVAGSGTGGYLSGIFGRAPTLGATTVISNCVAINPAITNTAGANFARIACAGPTAPTYTNNLAYDGTIVTTAAGVQAVAGLADNKDGLSKPLTDLMAQSTYEGLGWDFNNVWQMGIGENPYPVLKHVPFYIATGINSVADLKTKVYYSSQSGNIFVEGKSIGEVVTVYDCQGRFMLKSQESVLNISNLSKGIYLINISGNTTKIIKN